MMMRGLKSQDQLDLLLGCAAADIGITVQPRRSAP